MAGRRLKIATVGAIASLALASCVPLEEVEIQQPQRPDGSITGADFASQTLFWGDCGSIECAEVQAPLDWENPTAEDAIYLNVARLKSYSANPRGTIFVNPGGPGASGVSYLENAGSELAELRNDYHIVSWDPRGVDYSSAVSCLTYEELDEDLYGYDKDAPEPGSEAWLAQVKADNEDFAQKCVERSGELFKHVSTANTVQDLNLLRQLVKDEKLNYLGFSYGTYIGARYADKYPQLTGKIVLDGAIDPTADTIEVVVNQTKGFELALNNYLTDCVAKQSCWYTGDVAAGKERVKQLLAQVHKQPLKAADGRWVTSSVLLTAIITTLYSQDSWPFLTDLMSEIEKGQTETALLLADFYNDRSSSGSYLNNSREAFSAINCSDYTQQQPDLAAMRKNAEKLAAEAPIFGPYQGYSEASCWGWPVSADSRDGVTAAGSAPIVVIGTKGDPATPYQWAVSLAEQLENGVLVSYEGEGHIAFGTSSCVTDLVTKYFNRNVLPQHETVCEVATGDQL